jgi:hypothetical protein
LTKRTSAAKAATGKIIIYGTAEAVPLSKTLNLTHHGVFWHWSSFKIDRCQYFRLLASHCRGRYIGGFGRLGGLEGEKQIPPLRCGMTTKQQLQQGKAVGTRRAIATRKTVATRRANCIG